MTDNMIGTRIEYDGDGFPEPGTYYTLQGVWHARVPSGLFANLQNHQVTEHEDGTITVAPSILVNRGESDAWHGYLERGVWREV